MTHALGTVTQALGTLTHALGTVTQALGTLTHALGTVTQALGTLTHALGTVTHALGTHAGINGGRTDPWAPRPLQKWPECCSPIPPPSSPPPPPLPLFPLPLSPPAHPGPPEADPLVSFSSPRRCWGPGRSLLRRNWTSECPRCPTPLCKEDRGRGERQKRDEVLILHSSNEGGAKLRCNWTSECPSMSHSTLQGRNRGRGEQQKGRRDLFLQLQ